MLTIDTPDAPAAIGPYSQAKIYQGILYTSGQIPLDPVTGEIVGLSIKEQTLQVLRNIEAVLGAAGTSFEHVIKTSCFLADMADFAVFNELYAERFTSKPARSCIAAKQLPKGVLVEIELICALPEQR
ncbi:RidA family protein [Alcaligenes parafaecalis]|uniref:RidA family protein n=1 Tax=Alcaligenes parafaecalis TaxID=171260 RepID=A0ABT3VLD6_9BURK|nr:RidA family protein [Alcaligenes parafaecalis]MCX5463304.1 RidA family protein [Alcaligenes parafaecalis]